MVTLQTDGPGDRISQHSVMLTNLLLPLLRSGIIVLSMVLTTFRLLCLLLNVAVIAKLLLEL